MLVVKDSLIAGVPYECYSRPQENWGFVLSVAHDGGHCLFSSLLKCECAVRRVQPLLGVQSDDLNNRYPYGQRWKFNRGYKTMRGKAT